MFKKILFVFFLPAFFLLVQALNAAGNNPGAELTCSLPAPANLTVDPVGPTYATLSWDPVAGAWGYSIYLTGNGSTSNFITTTTSWNFMGLTPGVTYTVEVHAMCGPGSESPNYGATSFTTIVTEIICEANNSCTPGTIIGSGTTISHTWENYVDYLIFITNSSGTAKYTFYKTPNNEFPIQPLTNNPSEFNLGAASGRYCPSAGNSDQFWVSYSGNGVVMGKFEEKAAMFIIAAGYTVSIYNGSCTTHGGGGGGSMPPPAAPEASDRSSGLGNQVAALRPLPNPFSDELTLTGSAGTADDPVHISLFNAEGVLVRQQDAVIEGAYTLPTADLPQGVYFLQVRSSLGNTTHKLLKM